jgi:hypothetical protein
MKFQLPNPKSQISSNPQLPKIKNFPIKNKRAINYFTSHPTLPLKGRVKEGVMPFCLVYFY